MSATQNQPIFYKQIGKNQNQTATEGFLMSFSSKLPNFFYLAALIALGLFFLSRYGGIVFSIFVPFLLARALSSRLTAPTKYLSELFRISSKIVSVPIVLSFFAALFSFVYIAADRLIREAIGFFTAADRVFETLPERIGSLSDSVQKALSVLPFSEKLLSFIERALPTFSERFSAGLSSLAAETLPSFLVSVPRFFLAFAVGVLATCYFTAQKNETERFFIDRLSDKAKEFFTVFFSTLRDAAGGYLRAYGTIGLITFCELFAGLLFLCRDYALLAALAITFVDILPVLGSGTVLVPWALFEWAGGNGEKAVGLFVLYGIISVIRQGIEPRILGSVMGLSPLSALFFMYAGGRLCGIAGLFLFPFSAVIFKSLYEKGLFPYFRPPKKDMEQALFSAREKYRKYTKEK